MFTSKLFSVVGLMVAASTVAVAVDAAAQVVEEISEKREAEAVAVAVDIAREVRNAAQAALSIAQGIEEAANKASEGITEVNSFTNSSSLFAEREESIIRIKKGVDSIRKNAGEALRVASDPMRVIVNFQSIRKVVEESRMRILSVDILVDTFELVRKHAISGRRSASEIFSLRQGSDAVKNEYVFIVEKAESICSNTEKLAAEFELIVSRVRMSKIDMEAAISKMHTAVSSQKTAKTAQSVIQDAAAATASQE